MTASTKRRVMLVAAIVLLTGSLSSIAWQLFVPEPKPANPGNIVPAYHYPGGGKPPWMKDAEDLGARNKAATKPKS